MPTEALGAPTKAEQVCRGVAVLYLSQAPEAAAETHPSSAPPSQWQSEPA